MRVYPAIHYTMGGLWVDYNLMSTIPGLHVLGEANFSDHGANRLGASALMQGLADGYFVIPYTISNYIANATIPKIDTNHEAFKESTAQVKARIAKMMAVKGSQTVDEIHRKLGHIMWEYVGMSRDEQGLKKAQQDIAGLREQFHNDMRIPGTANDLNEELEKAGRLEDFIDLGDLMARDALERRESCGGHFRVESQTPDNEALRDDEHFAYVAAWEFKGQGQAEELHKEPLTFERVKLATRSYK
jgi:succinate dehydrogenase / fumarate reductase flavoprotein subunit